MLYPRARAAGARASSDPLARARRANAEAAGEPPSGNPPVANRTRADADRSIHDGGRSMRRRTGRVPQDTLLMRVGGRCCRSVRPLLQAPTVFPADGVI